MVYKVEVFAKELDMNFRSYQSVFLVIMLHFVDHGVVIQASASAPVATTISPESKQLFMELYKILIQNDPNGIAEFQRLLEQDPAVILEMQNKNNETLLDFAINNNKNFGFCKALINCIIKQMEARSEQKYLDMLLRQNFDEKKIIIFCLGHMLDNREFGIRIWRRFLNRSDDLSQLSKINKIFYCAYLFYQLQYATVFSTQNFKLEVETCLQRIRDLFETQPIQNLILQSIVTEALYYYGEQSLFSCLFTKINNEKVAGSSLRDIDVQGIKVRFECLQAAGIRLQEQSNQDNTNLIYLIYRFFKNDSVACQYLLNYLFEQGCDVNQQIISGVHKDLSASLLQFAINEHLGVEMIIFLIRNGANLFSLSLLNVQSEIAGQVVETSISSITPLETLVYNYSTDELSEIFSNIEITDEFWKPFIKKYPKESNGVIEYQECSQSLIVNIESQKNYAKIALLLKLGADVNQTSSSKSFSNWTALMMATDHADVNMVKFLLQSGANIEAPASDNNARIILARRIENLEQAKKQKLAFDKRRLSTFREIERMFQNPPETFVKMSKNLKKDLTKEETQERTKISEEQEQELQVIYQDYQRFINREQDATRRQQMSEKYQARLKEYNEQIAKEREQQQKDLENLKLKSEKEAKVVAKALPAVPMKILNPQELLQKFPYSALNGEQKNKVTVYLDGVTQNCGGVIPSQLQTQYGFRRELLGKKNVDIDLFHILFTDVSVKNNEVSFSGGHTEDTIQRLIQLPIITKATARIDEKTGCKIFRLYPAILNTPPIIKTVFPKLWSVENILQAIVSSEFVRNAANEEGMEVVYANTKTRPAIPLKLVFKKASDSDPMKLITVIPIPDTRD